MLASPRYEIREVRSIDGQPIWIAFDTFQQAPVGFEGPATKGKAIAAVTRLNRDYQRTLE